MSEELRRRREQLCEELRRLDAALGEAGDATESSMPHEAPRPRPASAGGESGIVSPQSSTAAEERFRLLVEYAPDAMVILDADTGRFVDVNEHASRLFGLPKARLLELGPVDLSPERQPDGTPSKNAATAWIQETIDGRPAEFEWTHVDAEGNVVPCEVRLVTLPHEDRNWLRGSIFDISERKRAEADRERLSRQLAQMQKLQAIGQLTGGVAHDFNNLLTVILGAITTIRNEPGDAVEVYEQASQAMAAAERAARLTQQLLAFARRQPLERRAVDVNELLLGTESLLGRAAGTGVSLETVLGTGLWHCETDRAELENALLNLVLNARDAMPGGGRVTIETANSQLDGDYALDHDEVEPGPYVMLSVTDNGTGMAPDVAEQAFEPFFTTKDVGHGTGLGLSMVYGFVKQCGGHLKIYSEPGEGTTVRIYLPRSPSEASGSAAAEEDPPEESDAKSNALVLVVEDEELVRSLIVRGLSSLGYRTLSAADAATALELARAHDDLDLLLSDLILAGTARGTELAREVRELRPGLPVLFMSGYAQSAVVQDGRLEPDASLLQKPFTHRELAFAVDEALTRGGN